MAPGGNHSGPVLYIQQFLSARSPDLELLLLPGLPLLLEGLLLGGVEPREPRGPLLVLLVIGLLPFGGGFLLGRGLRVGGHDRGVDKDDARRGRTG